MRKARFEMVLASVFALLTIATLIWPNWIEVVSGIEPDRGSGEAERWVWAVFAGVAVLATVLSRRDYRAAKRRLTQEGITGGV